MKKLIYIALICIFSVPLVVCGQVNEKIQEAYTLYKSGNLDKASTFIDQAVEMKKGSRKAVAWHIRGFIYKDIYLNAGDNKVSNEARITAIQSFQNAIKYNEDEAQGEQNRKALTFLSRTYFNDASDIIEKRNPETIDKAEEDYIEYRKLVKYLYPDSSLKEKDVEFYLAMATAHRKIYEKDREVNAEHYTISNNYMKRVLEIDPQNYPAYYSLAVAHYNNGAHNLEHLPEVTNIPDIYDIQLRSMSSIETALEYMMRAYEINPERIEAVKGLKVIYFNLNNPEESDEMREKEKELKEHQK